MKKDLPVALLAVAVAALVVIAIRQRAEIARLREPVPAARVEPARAAQPPRTAAPPVVERAPELAAAPVVPPAAAPAAPKPSGMLAGLGAMAKDPAMREMMRAQQKLGFDMMYGSLARSLNLSADELTALKDLLADRQMAMMDASLSLMSGDLPAADRAQKAKEIEAAKASFDKKIEDLLGAEDFALFKEFEQTQSERMQVNLFKQSLAGADALTDDQESDLVAALYDERQRFPQTAWMKNTAPDPAQFTEERMTEMVKQMEQLHAKYVQRAGEILGAAQLEQFTKSLDQQRQMMVGAMKMAGQMFGQPKPAAPAPAPGAAGGN